MKKYAVVLIIAVVAIAIVVIMQMQSSEELPQTAAAPGFEDPHAGHAHGSDDPYRGKVMETMDAGGYTYVHLDTGKEKIWAAGPQTAVEKGSEISFPEGMQMTNFHSESLDRTFDAIFFVSEFHTGAETATAPSTPPGHPPVTSSDADKIDVSGITVPDGGTSIESVHSDRSGLTGKRVLVRGKVVKFTPGVMGKNWIHLRDGTGSEGTNDLTVTTDATVKVGDIVLARGVVATDKDFGFGYAYDVLVEDAEVSLEQ
jgi:hypothetical protein